MFKKIIPYLITLIFLLIGLNYFITNYPKFRQISVVSWLSVLGIIVTYLIVYILNALVFKTLLKIFCIPLTFPEAIALSFITLLGNYILPGVGGMGLRAAYLKKRYHFPVSQFMSTIAATALITVTVNALIGLLAFFYLFYTRGLYNWLILGILAVIFTGCVLVIIFPFKPLRSNYFLVRKFNEALEGWQRISKNKRRLRNIALIIIGISIVMIMNLYFTFRVFMVTVKPLDTMLISSLDTIATLINITPGALGVSEGVVVFISRVLNYLPVITLTSVMIRRVVAFSLTIIGGSLSSFFLTRSALNKEIGQN